MLRSTAFPQWARLGLLALGYFAAAKASLLFAIPPGYATAIWPPSGIALAALLLWGMRAWPGVWLGAALTNYSVNLSMPAALGIASGNTLEGLCAAWLVSRWTERNTEFRQPEKVFLFAAIAALASAVAASFGVASLYAFDAVEAGQLLGNWYTWWQGDFSGILLVTPCILAWSRQEPPSVSRAGARELGVFTLLLVATLGALFPGGTQADEVAPLVFLVIPFYVWAACRFGERAVTLTVLAANGWAVWSTANGMGPFLSDNLNRDLLMLQAFTATGALVALVLWALMRRRSDQMHDLETSRDELGQHLWSQARGLREQLAECKEAMSLARVGTWRWDGRSEHVEWSDEAGRICGFGPGRLQGSFDAYYDLVHLGDLDRVRATLKDAYVNHKSWDRTERIVRRDGEVRVLRSIGRSTAPRQGSSTRMHGVLIDISEYRAAAAVKRPEPAADALTDLGLPDALRARAAQFEIRTGVDAEVSSSDAAGGIDAVTALALYRIADDALDNVARHAGAHRVNIELDYDSELATLTVRDDGSGFAPEWQAKGGAGIKRMRERAAAAGGKVWIESTPGNGSTLRVTARG
ncbi:MAG TPA: MASE1 domain-containing protein [Burkholderiales bacterium]